MGAPDGIWPSSFSPSAALDEVRRIVLTFLEGQAAEVYLFGSRARGTARPNSDVDVAIRARQPLPRALLARLGEALEESQVPWIVDLVDLSQAAEPLRRRVLQEGIPWSV